MQELKNFLPGSDKIEDLLHHPHHKESADVLYPRFIGPQDVVVEVGTFHGGGTLVLAKLARQVYSFEPNNELYNKTVHNTTSRKNVQIFNVALGSSNNTALLYNYIKDGKKVPAFSSIRDRTPEKKNLKIYEKVAVKMERLDDQKFPLKPTALVSDCEGGEVEVLKGGRSLIPSLRVLLIEVHKTKEELIDILSKFPFKISYEEYYPFWLVATNLSNQFLS